MLDTPERSSIASLLNGTALNRVQLEACRVAHFVDGGDGGGRGSGGRGVIRVAVFCVLCFVWLCAVLVLVLALVLSTGGSRCSKRHGPGKSVSQGCVSAALVAVPVAVLLNIDIDMTSHLLPPDPTHSTHDRAARGSSTAPSPPPFIRVLSVNVYLFCDRAPVITTVVCRGVPYQAGECIMCVP